MKGGLPGGRVSAGRIKTIKEAASMLYVGGDLSRKRIDVHVMYPDGSECLSGAAPPDREGLVALAGRLKRLDEELVVVIESMTGARFVHDLLEREGLDVRVADARKAKVAAELLGQIGAKTDKLDARLLAELARRDLVPEIWLPEIAVCGTRERSRFRIHLVRHRTMLKNRIHQTLAAHGITVGEADLFGRAGRERLERLELPEPWQTSVRASLELIDHLDRQIDEQQRQLRIEGADHPYVPLLITLPGVGPVLGYAIASEIGDITRFASPNKLIGYTGLCPKVIQSGESDRRGPLRKNGPKWLRWALIEASTVACRHPLYRDLYQATKNRAGKQRGSRVAQITIARKLAEASWYMLTRNQPFAPAGAAGCLAP
jgi:transposase